VLQGDAVLVVFLPEVQYKPDLWCVLQGVAGCCRVLVCVAVLVGRIIVQHKLDL